MPCSERLTSPRARSPWFDREALQAAVSWQRSGSRTGPRCAEPRSARASRTIMPTNKTVWVIAADASRARVLQVASPKKLTEVTHLDNPEGRMQDRELTTDAHPRFRGSK